MPLVHGTEKCGQPGRGHSYGGFYSCEKLKKLALPASLVNVGSEPFANCTVLNLSVAKKREAFAVMEGTLVAK